MGRIRSARCGNLAAVVANADVPPSRPLHRNATPSRRRRCRREGRRTPVARWRKLMMRFKFSLSIYRTAPVRGPDAAEIPRRASWINAKSVCETSSHFLPTTAGYFIFSGTHSCKNTALNKLDSLPYTMLRSSKTKTCGANK